MYVDHLLELCFFLELDTDWDMAFTNLLNFGIKVWKCDRKCKLHTTDQKNLYL